jgi:hypothetical protein
MLDYTPRFIFAGLLQRDFILLPSGQAVLDIPGGNALYAAVGCMVWEPDSPPGILARVGEDYPQTWIESFQQRGIDTRGINILPQALDVRNFRAYTSREGFTSQDPTTHFANHGLTFPRALLGYSAQDNPLDSRINLNEYALRQSDLIDDYMNANAIHFCPMNYLSHSLLPALLRQAAFTTITLDPNPGYMNTTFWDDVPGIITGLTAFLPSERQLRNLFQARSEDLWEMIETVASYGCEIVAVKRGEGGQLLYDNAARTRYEISAYDSRTADTAGAGSAFCGGFLAGYRRTYDPLQAVLYGNISASLVVEGSGPFYALDALPGLAQARLDAISQMVRRV